MKRFCDPFLASLMGAVVMASFAPCPSSLQPWLERLTSALIMIMFFMQGSKLQRHVVIESLQDWRVQGATLLTSFVLFPLIGLLIHCVSHSVFASDYLGRDLWIGVMFLCCLPSTIQSSIALTSIARGNVPASMCAATVSNIVGIVATPILARLIFHGHEGGVSIGHVVVSVGVELLLPFIMGQLLQKWTRDCVHRHKRFMAFTDRGSILIIVYAAFSEAVIHGLWKTVTTWQLVTLSCVDAVLLGIILALSWMLGRIIGLTEETRISLQFCGSKKALSVGVSMSNIIFPTSVGIIVLPLMIFHQIQLLICTILANHYAKRRM